MKALKYLKSVSLVILSAGILTTSAVCLEKVSAQPAATTAKPAKDNVDRLLDEGKNVVLEIEVQGALQVMKKCPDALTIFLVPPSLEELERRIRGRRTESEDIVKERLDKARKEIQTKDEYKYVVENDDVHLAKDKIAKIIKEHQK